MSYLVLARKWRPQTFDQIVGQEAITRALKNAIRQDRVAHAFLFAGPRGVGKTTMARVLAKALNCDTGPTDTPCDKCGPCHEITAGSSMDVLEIDGASNTGVDDVRELRETVKYMPSGSRNKIYIIDEVHMLSSNAFNALLKTLEEPPKHVIFIFATTEPHKIPATVQSRCQRYDFRRITMKAIVDRLSEITTAENITLGEKALRIIAREAQGSMRDALSLLDQVISFAGIEATDEDVNQILDIIDRQHLYNISAAVLKHDAHAGLEVIEELDRSGCDFKNFTAELQNHFRNLAVVSYTRSPERLMELSDDEISELKKQAELTNPETLQLLFDLLTKAEESLARSNQPRWILEMALAKMASLHKVTPLADIMKKLEALEKRIISGTPLSNPPAPRSNPEQGASHSPDEAPSTVLFEGMPDPSSSAPEHTHRPNPADRSWDDFLEFVHERDAKTYSLLSQGVFKDIADKEVQVLFTKDSFALQMLEESKRLKAIDNLLGEYLGPGFHLAIKQSQNHNPPAAQTNSIREKEMLRREALSDATVKAAREMLDGEIIEIRVK